MIAVIFEVEPAEGKRHAYLNTAAKLRAQLEAMDGFISVERFESLTTPGKLLSLSFWRDEAAVAGWRAHAPRVFPLPHPSWRNTGWLKRNPWFEAELLPALRARVREVLDDAAAGNRRGSKEP